MKKLSLLILSMMCTFLLTAQTPGTLYHLFGDNGIVLTDYEYDGDDDNLCETSMMQSDLKIVLGGRAYINGKANLMFVRYNPHGSIDIGFGENGIKVLYFGGSHDYLTDIAQQADGKIVAVGWTKSDSITKMMALRLNTDGSLDSTFNVSGMTTIEFGIHTEAVGLSVGILEDGKIMISGYVSGTTLTYHHIALCRLTSTGILDNTFGVNGLLTTGYTDLWCFPDEMVIHNDRITLGGVSLNPDFERFATFFRYHLDGSVDFDFGDNGICRAAIGENALFGTYTENGMCLAPDGKILFAFTMHPEWLGRDFAVMRFTQDGFIDNSFGVDGFVVHEMDENSYAHAVLAQADGKVIAAGTYISPDPDGDDFMITRYLENGELDTDFGLAGTGMVITNVSPGSWYSDGSTHAIFCNADRLLVSGVARTDHGDPDFAMACYHTGVSVGISKHEASEIDLSVHPNPVVDHADISFSLAHPANVEIEVHNVSGNLINLISNAFYPEGEHQLRWNCEELPAGVYIIKLQTAERLYTTKVIKSN